MALNINGRMKVKTLKTDFKKGFGLNIRVYDGRKFANEDATLASIRKGDSTGGEFSPKRNTKVGNLEDKIMDIFGLKTQISGSDDSYLCDNDLTLAGALSEDEKKMERRAKKSTPEKVIVSSATSMTISKIISELKDTYSNHEDLEEMVADLEDGGYFDHWADQLCTESFNKNITLAKALFEHAIVKAENTKDICDIAESISDSEKVNDKEWAQTLYKTAASIAEDYDDNTTVAQSVVNEDPIWAKKLLEISQKDADSSSALSFIANIASVIDKEWARSLYSDSLDLANDAWEYENLATYVKEYLNDNEWAQEILDMSPEDGDEVDDDMFDDDESDWID